MNRIITCLILILIMTLASSCGNSSPQTEFEKKSEALSVVLDNTVFTQIQGINDPEVNYISTVKEQIDQTASKLFNICSVDNATITDKSSFTLYVLQVMGVNNQLQSVSEEFQKHMLYIVDMLSTDVSDDRNSYAGIKKSLLDGNEAALNSFSLFAEHLEKYKKAEEAFKVILTDVLSLITPEDMTQAISKMTGEEAQSYYLECLDYLYNLLDIEEKRAMDVVKAQKMFSVIN